MYVVNLIRLVNEQQNFSKTPDNKIASTRGKNLGVSTIRRD